jgi:hypothetical protein
MGRQLRGSVHIIGYPRSGTTLLGRILARHERLRYLSEPRYIWTIGNGYRSHDQLDANDLSPRIARKIDAAFHRYLEDAADKWLLEKTPSNCLRIPFICALYPDARFIHLIRDGRDVVKSQYQRENAPKTRYLKKRIPRIPISQWPGHLPAFFRSVVRPMVLRKRVTWWGPRPPGWRHMLKLPPHVRIARQWEACMKITLAGFQSANPQHVLEIRYEELLQDSEKIVDNILQFLNLNPSEAIRNYMRDEVEPGRKRWTSILTPEQEKEVESILKPTLEQLGYIETASRESIS